MPYSFNKVAFLGRIAVTLLLAAPCPCIRAQGGVGVPNSSYSVEGNTNSYYPFAVEWPYTCRYQQVYAASQFSTISSGTQDEKNYFSAITNGGWISDLFFRFEGGSPGFNVTVSNVEVHLCTTQRQPDGLSSVFSDNVGEDDTTVFSGSFILFNSSSSRPTPYDSHVALNTNFWYNPKLGNLLLDVRLYNGGRFILEPLDAVSVTGDSVSSVYNAWTTNSVNETSGTVDTTGLVTLFAMAPPPILQASITNFATPTNYFVAMWRGQPTGFVLQAATSLGSKAAWQTVPGTGSTNGAFTKYQTPIGGVTANSFFRLARPGSP